MSQLWDVADGLHYLHSCEVIHGTLEAVSRSVPLSLLFGALDNDPMNSKANILIDKDGRARLAGFELTSMTRAVEDLDTTGTAIWAAREALGAGPMTKEGDVFRFGILVVEVRLRVFGGIFPAHLAQQGGYGACPVFDKSRRGYL